MRHLKCSSCTKEFPAAQMFTVGGAVVCESCGDRLLEDAAAKHRKPEVTRVIDATICSRCKADNGETDFRIIGGAPFCPRCTERLYAYPFPLWLKASAAVSVLLLGFALWHDAPYFAAGAHLTRARRAMEAHDYKTAVTHFAEVLPVKPTEQDVILPAARAYLMTGDVAGAGAFLDLRSEYTDNDEFKSVNQFWSRANLALVEADSANKLVQANRTADAQRLMTKAARDYPEVPAFAVGALLIKGGDAFEHKDYDTFLTTSREARTLMPEEPRLIAGVASALAAKYAVTGNAAYRAEAESLLAVAETVAQRSAEDKTAYDEYAERIRHRLATRIVINGEEYNRRFRAKEASSP
jgi:DNA-directed RNA polymerase subunit RPC12/RpoP